MALEAKDVFLNRRDSWCGPKMSHVVQFNVQCFGHIHKVCILGATHLSKRALSDDTCTDEILISDVNSYKSSLAIIHICLKMYCYKYAC